MSNPTGGAAGDVDLDAILDSALDDFDRPEAPPAAASTPAVATPGASPAPPAASASLPMGLGDSDLLNPNIPLTAEQQREFDEFMRTFETTPEGKALKDAMGSLGEESDPAEAFGKILASLGGMPPFGGAAGGGPAAPPAPFPFPMPGGGAATAPAPAAAASPESRGTAAAAAATAGAAATSSSSSEDPYQDAIRMLSQGMSGIQQSLPPEFAGMMADPEFAKILDEMTKRLEGLNPENPDDLEKALDMMMGDMLTKDNLYDSCKQLADKLPGWLAENKATVSADDLTRYQGQLSCFQRLVVTFETTPDDKKKVMELTKELRAFGAPPQALLKQLMPDATFDAEGMPVSPAGMGFPPGMVPDDLQKECVIQ